MSGRERLGMKPIACQATVGSGGNQGWLLLMMNLLVNNLRQDSDGLALTCWIWPSRSARNLTKTTGHRLQDTKNLDMLAAHKE